MSLISNWRERKELIGRTTGRSLWFLIAVLILVVVFFVYLGRLEHNILK